MTTAVAPRESEQSGNWVATITSSGGSADVTVAPRNDKESLVKISVRDIALGGSMLSWNVFVGRCSDRRREPIIPGATLTPVRTQMDGSGTAAVWVPKLESGKRYSVGVRFAESATTGGTASCANLKEKP